MKRLATVAAGVLKRFLHKIINLNRLAIQMSDEHVPFSLKLLVLLLCQEVFNRNLLSND